MNREKSIKGGALYHLHLIVELYVFSGENVKNEAGVLFEFGLESAEQVGVVSVFNGFQD